MTSLPSQSPPSSSWQTYFSERKIISCPTRHATFNVYLAGPPSGPIIFCLHGGGYTGLTWSLISSELRSTCRIVAPDLRGHGATITDNDDDLSAETMALDVVAIWQSLFMPSAIPSIARESESKPEKGEESQQCSTVLVGHSMGGAIAVHAASLFDDEPVEAMATDAANTTVKPKKVSKIRGLEGIVVVDVVEGTALASLPFMQGVLKRRPASFPDPTAAVEWALETGFSRCAAAAAVSVPSMLKEKETSSDGGKDTYFEEDKRIGVLRKIAEEREKNGERPPLPTSAVTTTAAVPSTSLHLKTSMGTHGAYIWRTDLEKSSQYWEGWYTGLSSLFLALSVPKMLILAGTDRLDKELMIGQMQGKFQLVLLSRAGHAVHEDEAREVASAVSTFIHRFKIGQVDKSFLPGIDPTGKSLFRVPEVPATRNVDKS